MGPQPIFSRFQNTVGKKEWVKKKGYMHGKKIEKTTSTGRFAFPPERAGACLLADLR